MKRLSVLTQCGASGIEYVGLIFVIVVVVVFAAYFIGLGVKGWLQEFLNRITIAS